LTFEDNTNTLLTKYDGQISCKCIVDNYKPVSHAFLISSHLAVFETPRIA